MFSVSPKKDNEFLSALGKRTEGFLPHSALHKTLWGHVFGIFPKEVLPEFV